jgi:hypothetical protein
MPFRILLLFLSFLVLLQCSQDAPPSSYESDILKWQDQRNKELRDSTGWLALEGLFWLKEGKHSFGSGRDQTYIFPEAFPETAGFFELDSSGQITLIRTDSSFDVRINNQPAATREILSPDYPGPATQLWYNSWLLYAISRSEGKAIRLIHTESEKLKQFSGMDFFPIDSTWKIPAVFQPFDTLRTLPVPTVLGSMRPEPWPGNLVFSFQGEQYTLAPTSQPSDESWFIVFGDQTNGDETYGGGRFLYVQKPDAEGNTFLDFNRAYSPPCLFSIHATCPLPPSVNRLPFAIRAGEKADFENH